MPSFFRFGFRLIIRIRLRLVLDDHARLDQAAVGLRGEIPSKRAALLRGHLRQAVRDRAGDVDLLTILPFLWLPARQPSQRRVGVGTARRAAWGWPLSPTMTAAMMWPTNICRSFINCGRPAGRTALYCATSPVGFLPIRPISIACVIRAPLPSRCNSLGQPLAASYSRA